ncbi:ephrin-4-like isoform X2 [Gigantopelta aegis]|uniref:ephrin-4-like isoform X2 n=1 Tax=Gigantopelta aegis TaxID=1735272 RepID=UPI001B88D967|nr:ephrin-4-like isoform X2 [Gigantopelta aegis]
MPWGCELPVSILIWIYCVFLLHCNAAFKQRTIYWNATNPMFHTSNNDHILNVNMRDRIDIYCPWYSPSSSSDTWEYYVIYMVKRADEFNQCFINNTSRAFFILNCSNPAGPAPYYATIYVYSFNGNPSNPDFVSGHSYYFLTTSGGAKHEINNQFHGACLEKNMKMQLNIFPALPVVTTAKPFKTPGSNIKPPTRKKETATTPTTTTTSAPDPPTTPRKIATHRTTSITQAPTVKNRVPGNGDSIPDENVIDVTGQKNVGLISDSASQQTAVTSFSLILLTLAVTLWQFHR